MISALLKKSTTRDLILSELRLELFAPEFLRIEVEKHLPMIVKRSLLKETEVRQLLDLLFTEITEIPNKVIEPCIPEAMILMESVDKKDMVYYAAALCINAHGIWTNDRDFQVIDKYSVLSTSQLLNKLVG